MNKWKMNRAGLLNFWYYDEEIFTFADGKLLLRGSNGSGKSVTMQSFLPVLLDGRTSPDRLDPFGSKARRMEDYLLGEKDIVNREERTGYLFLEFKREETEQFTTIGIGLQAKRNKQMKFWGFVITDNRRIGIDIELYKLEKNAGEKQKIPLSRVELENLINDGGHVVQTKADYMKLVNKYLFGFETVEAYEDLIKLLIQLRSPKLSKDFRPTVIYEILEAALPPLSDDDLRHLSDTIEQMDQTKQQIDQLDREVSAINSLNRIYDMYNQRILTEQANEYLQSSNRLSKEKKAYEQLTDERECLDQEIALLEGEISDLALQYDANKKQEERLRSHKVWNLEKERQEVEEKLQIESTNLERKSNQLQERRGKQNQLLEEQNQIDEMIVQREEVVNDKLLDMLNDAEEASLKEVHVLNKTDFVRHQDKTFNFSVWLKETGNHLAALEAIEIELRNFENLKAKYQEKDKELGEETKSLDEVSYQEQAWSRLFEEDKEKKLNEIHTWIGGSTWLNFQGNTLQETARTIHSLYEPTTYETVKEPFRKAVFDYEREQGKLQSELQFKMEQLNSQIEEKKIQLQEWKEKKDPELQLDALTKDARLQLDEKNVSYVPFYAAVEFQEHVSQDIQKRIEAAMIESGMLDALIAEDNLEVKHDRILIPAPNMMTFTLADYLKPALDEQGTISARLVDDILRSITIGEESDTTFRISEQGHYQLGLLKGHALPVDNVRYIGRNARKRFREEQIEIVQYELDKLQEEKQLISGKIQDGELAISQVKIEFERFPDDKDLQESFQQIQEMRLNVDHHKKHIQRLSNDLKDIHNEYSKVRRVIDERTREFNLTVNLDAYREAIAVVKRYEKDLSELEKQHIQYVNDCNRKEDISERIRELEQDVIEISGEINILNDTISGMKQNLKMIIQHLERQGVEDIRKQIADVQQALKVIGEGLEAKKIDKPSKETKLDQVKKELDSKRQQIDFWKNMLDSWRFSLEQEITLGFGTQDKEKDMDEIARDVLKEAQLKETDRTKLSSQLTQEYYKQLSDLMEYRANIFQETKNIPAWMNDVVNEEHLPHIEQWKQKSTRQLIELHYQGKQVSPYFVQNQIEMEQARQESYLDEQDQALYEEILFNSVGQKLRARIRRAEQWVNEMKNLMEARDTSSGLSFSIKWKPRTADSEMEMDTADLVQLLKQDSKLLKEDDREKIIIHFRSKISKAKEMVGGTSELQTLLQVLKEVLDYRKWFSFVLYFQREGEKKRELNNNQFYKFSGGEKAMAMYIPLFTACYSRYSEADAAAPYIISLDEAFAGVDENNIREMFEIVEQLGFNYMMNSQVLWGDYDTIRELSICELVRPKNADFVSVLRYHWDGNKMDVNSG
ncbi:TIGR02680 family protein [Virgibacillus halodenitrificans]|uniref:TIGR02680 family protein n=1 Tax=Virgibacillus halodenitrificans TaxID=1482 RepID=UPI001F17633A|nr:TIGR02680 family protein [Virgibacillus halodenitrificans]MCG1029622.1 TIGR02680 family protein [Virgibacillus halodenitrificans]